MLAAGELVFTNILCHVDWLLFAIDLFSVQLDQYFHVA